MASQNKALNRIRLLRHRRTLSRCGNLQEFLQGLVSHLPGVCPFHFRRSSLYLKLPLAIANATHSCSLASGIATLLALPRSR